MAELHEALTALAPIDYEDVPQDDLKTFLTATFAAGELIGNSVPPPANGLSFESSTPHHSTPNVATSSQELHVSTARPPPADAQHEALQKNWGKPYKMSQKDNPLNIAVFKMAGHDRHGAWFARRSVHEGIGFAKIKKAMQREFPQSLAVQGGPGEGNVRGIGGDRRIVRKEIEGVGRMEVYQLSAQFPGPTTPRDFMTLLLTGSEALTEKSAAHVQGGKHVPRHYMIVSKPVKHPDAPERSGYIRGQYESVELIREIPLHASKAASTTDLPNANLSADRGRQRGSTIGFAEGRGASAKGELMDRTSVDGPRPTAGSHDPELNPVEWIMITRSDPGGGIPRFMVERGTPSAMVSDVSKFLDWACGRDEIPDEDADIEHQEATNQQTAEVMKRESISSASGAPPNGHVNHSIQGASEATTPVQSEPQQGGILSSLTTAVGAGIETYAPAAVASYLPHHAQQASTSTLPEEEDDDSSDSSSIDSFASAEEERRRSFAPGSRDEALLADSAENLSLTSVPSSPESITTKEKSKGLNNHEREVLKLKQQQETLNQKLAKKRIAEEKKLRASTESESAEQRKAQEKYEREVRKTEERHKKEMEKLERKKEKETRKAEDKRRKNTDRDNLSKVSRERDEFRTQADMLKRENLLLQEQIRDLQRENTVMVSRIGKMGGGMDVLRSVRDEAQGRKRGSSVNSWSSRMSRESPEGVGEKGGKEVVAV